MQYKCHEKSHFVSCIFQSAIPPPTSPCQPNPCGPYSECRQGSDDQAICSCLPGYFGNPCRPECIINSDCPLNKACVNNKCVDPCEGSCGTNAICTVVSHKASCSCPNNFSGNPYSRCSERGKRSSFFIETSFHVMLCFC